MTYFQTFLFRLHRRRWWLLASVLILSCVVILSNGYVTLTVVRTNEIRAPKFSFDAFLGYFNVFDAFSSQRSTRKESKPLLLKESVKPDVKVKRSHLQS